MSLARMLGKVVSTFKKAASKEAAADVGYAYPGTGYAYPGSSPGKDDEEEEEEEEEDDDAFGSEDANSNVERVYFTDLSIGDGEKVQVFKTIGQMRADAAFCDVAFLCGGELFRGHRVVLSAFSRWMRGLLFETPQDDIISLTDVFDPVAFGLVLDYMYGIPLRFNMEIAESIIKVVRRLEMAQLEQQCWKFLITIIDSTNCERLHELADKYDCPPLKLSAWRALQESTPGYSLAPGDMMMTVAEGGDSELHHGLTGPGEFQWMQGYEDNVHHNVVFEEHEEPFEVPSVLERSDRTEDDVGDEDNDDEDDDDDGEREEKAASPPKPRSVRTRPEDLSASAADVVKAWASRLGSVYDDCQAQASAAEGADDDDAMRGEVKFYRRERAAGSPSRSKPLEPRPSPARVGLQALHSPEVESIPTAKSQYDWKSELQRFYIAIKAPEKIAAIDEILALYRNKEEQMISSLLVKYRRVVPPDMAEHLQQLYLSMESRSEASYRR